MKKRIMATMMAMMLVFASCMCVTAAPATQTTSKQTTNTVPVEEFTLLDLTEDMIDAGMYAEKGTVEIVIALFTLDTEQYLSVMLFDGSDNSADVLCGVVDATNTKVTNKDTRTVFTDVVDVYTGDTFSLTIDESSKPYVMDPTGTKYNAENITAEDTIDLMAAILALEGTDY